MAYWLHTAVLNLAASGGKHRMTQMTAIQSPFPLGGGAYSAPLKTVSGQVFAAVLPKYRILNRLNIVKYDMQIHGFCG